MSTLENIAVPWIDGAFRHILHPPGGNRTGRTNPSEQWYINDHCFCVQEGRGIHWFGITNPYPTDGTSLYGPGSHRHIGHAFAPHPFGPWEHRDPMFALPEGTEENVGACFVIPFGDKYLMAYDYKTGLNFAVSSDLDHWPKDDVFLEFKLGPCARDPYILSMEDGSYLLYGAGICDKCSSVLLASSQDLVHWERQNAALLTDVPSPYGALESPCVHRWGDDFYLFVNYSHRQYEETLVFHSRNPRRFDWNHPLGTLFAHAAEIFSWGGRTYISHCGIEDRHWDDTGSPYGLWLAELRWAIPT